MRLRDSFFGLGAGSVDEGGMGMIERLGRERTESEAFIAPPPGKRVGEMWLQP